MLALCPATGVVLKALVDYIEKPKEATKALVREKVVIV